jgi:hypothetical protein
MTTSAVLFTEKVQGEIVNHPNQVHRVLERGWNVNEKVVGNSHLLLWPPQTLLWWAVDYNKLDCVQLILDFTSLRSMDTLREALAWAKRKYNEECASCIEREISKKSNAVQSPEEDQATILCRLTKLRHEQHDLSSKLEHQKHESEVELQMTLRELSCKRERFLDLDKIRTQLKESVENSRDQLDRARIMYEAAIAHYESEDRALQCTEADLKDVMRDLNLLQLRKDRLETTLRTTPETVKMKVLKKAESTNKLECPICRDEDISVSFQCGHSFCKQCVDRMYSMKRASSSSSASSRYAAVGVEIKCPMCKATVKSVHPLFL